MVKNRRLRFIKDQLGRQTDFTYDREGNLLKITYPKIEGQTSPDAETFDYDDQGNITTSVNRREQPIKYTYNGRGQVLSKTHFDGSQETYTYDDRGNLLTATDEHGTIQMTYDTADRLLLVNYPNGRFLSYSYDVDNRLASMEDQDGNATNYDYNEIGRLTSLTDENNDLIVEYVYDSLGRLVRENNGNGTFTTYEYDSVGQLLHLVNHATDGEVNSRFDYTYDDLGRRTTMSTLDGQWVYNHDAIGQLTKAVFTSSNPDIPDQDITYNYDAAGNRTSVVRNGETTTYGVNARNQYTTVGAATYTYDDDGNLVSRVEGADSEFYIYDDEGQLIEMTTTEGTWRYEYDALGNRIATIHDGVRTEYLLDPTGLVDVVAEYDGNGKLLARYNHGFGLESREGADGSAAFYDFDVIGSTAGITGSDGSYVNEYRYLPYGGFLVDPLEALANPFAFVGQAGVMQEGNGLDFMRARFYSSEDGRFTSEDPIGHLGGINLYQYVGNRTTNRVDPSGLVDPFLVFVAGTIVAVIVGGRAPEIAAVVKGELARRQALKAAASAAQKALPAASSEALVAAETEVAISVGGSATPAAVPSGLALLTETTVASASVGAIAGTVAVGFAIGFGIGTLAVHLVPRLGTFFGDLAANYVETGDLLGRSLTDQVASFDPNDILGPRGVGDDRFVSPLFSMPYTIRFENKDTATAPAQTVVITQQLDADLDFTTFELGTFGFGDRTYNIPAGRTSYQTRLDLRETDNIFLDVDANIDVLTGLATWTFTSVDPVTFDLPTDPLAGFLPPNKSAPEGEGFVTYRVRPKEDLPTGTRIDAEARIIFDINEPIDTPAIFNTIDAGEPSSSVSPLPAATGSTDFTVSWSGIDDGDGNPGSGIDFFDIFVSTDGGAFEPFLLGTTETSATFTGEVGKQYQFYSIATDRLGHREPTPSGAQASTYVLFPLGIPVDDDDTTNEVLEGSPTGVAVGLTIFAESDPTTTVSYQLAEDADGRFTIDSTSGQVTVNDASLLNFEDATSHTITVEAKDSVDRTTTASFLIQILNDPPTTPVDDDNSPNEVPEGVADGTPVGITAFADDVNGPSVTYSLTNNAGDRFAIDSASGVVTVADTTLLVPNTTYTITAQASDGAGGTSTQDFTISVIAASSSFSVELNSQQTTVDYGATWTGTFSFTDATDAGPWYAYINYGDGTIDDANFLDINPNGTIAIDHRFLSSGTHTIKVTVFNNRGESTSDTMSVNVGTERNNVAFMEDGNLVVLGSESFDYIKIYDESPGKVIVWSYSPYAPGAPYISQTRAFTMPSGDSRIIVHAKGGNDLIYARSQNPTEIFAGEGNDIVFAMGGNAVIRGEGGNDALIGLEGENILIGGYGRDYLHAKAGDAILIGGHTDRNYENLRSDFDTWRQPDVRTLANLFATVSDPDDPEETDILIGGSGKTAFMYRRRQHLRGDWALRICEEEGDSDEGMTFS